LIGKDNTLQDKYSDDETNSFDSRTSNSNSNINSSYSKSFPNSQYNSNSFESSNSYLNSSNSSSSIDFNSDFDLESNKSKSFLNSDSYNKKIIEKQKMIIQDRIVRECEIKSCDNTLIKEEKLSKLENFNRKIDIINKNIKIKMQKNYNKNILKKFNIKGNSKKKIKDPNNNSLNGNSDSNIFSISKNETDEMKDCFNKDIKSDLYANQLDSEEKKKNKKISNENSQNSQNSQNINNNQNSINSSIESSISIKGKNISERNSHTKNKDTVKLNNNFKSKKNTIQILNKIKDKILNKKKSQVKDFDKESNINKLTRFKNEGFGHSYFNNKGLQEYKNTNKTNNNNGNSNNNIYSKKNKNFEINQNKNSKFDKWKISSANKNPETKINKNLKNLKTIKSTESYLEKEESNERSFSVNILNKKKNQKKNTSKSSFLRNNYNLHNSESNCISNSNNDDYPNSSFALNADTKKNKDDPENWLQTKKNKRKETNKFNEDTSIFKLKLLKKQIIQQKKELLNKKKTNAKIITKNSLNSNNNLEKNLNTNNNMNNIYNIITNKLSLKQNKNSKSNTINLNHERKDSEIFNISKEYNSESSKSRISPVASLIKNPIKIKDEVKNVFKIICLIKDDKENKDNKCLLEEERLKQIKKNNLINGVFEDNFNNNYLNDISIVNNKINYNDTLENILTKYNIKKYFNEPDIIEKIKNNYIEEFKKKKNDLESIRNLQKDSKLKQGEIEDITDVNINDKNSIINRKSIISNFCFDKTSSNLNSNLNGNLITNNKHSFSDVSKFNYKSNFDNCENNEINIIDSNKFLNYNNIIELKSCKNIILLEMNKKTDEESKNLICDEMKLLKASKDNFCSSEFILENNPKIKSVHAEKDASSFTTVKRDSFNNKSNLKDNQVIKEKQNENQNESKNQNSKQLKDSIIDKNDVIFDMDIKLKIADKQEKTNPLIETNQALNGKLPTKIFNDNKIKIANNQTIEKKDIPEKDNSEKSVVKTLNTKIPNNDNIKDGKGNIDDKIQFYIINPDDNQNTTKNNFCINTLNSQKTNLKAKFEEEQKLKTLEMKEKMRIEDDHKKQNFQNLIKLNMQKAKSIFFY